MDAKQLKEKITIEQIVQLMHKLGAESKSSLVENEILFTTICHNGDSHKLYFYKDSKEFYCYSHCGHLDIINIVEQVLNKDITQAIAFISNLFGFENVVLNEGFDNVYEYSEDLELIKNFKSVNDQVEVVRKFEILDKKLLERFYKLYHPAFYNDGISIETLVKFDIRYDILEQRIIIPHLDELGNMIAVRCRNLREELIEENKKYMPIVLDKKLLSAKITMYLYGLYFNKDNIKRAKKVILLESEKAVMQLDSILKGSNIGVALSSSSLSSIQVELLRELGVEEVIIGLDKEFKEADDQDAKLYAMKIRKGIVNKLLPYFRVSVIWDNNNLLDEKESPTDRGSEVFMKLYEERLKIN